MTGEIPVVDFDTQELLSPFTGSHVGIEQLQDAADALQQAFHDAGYTFVQVVLPEQSLESAEIQLQVIPFEVDQISITGNRYFSHETIRWSLPQLAEGETPNTRNLSRSLAVARRHSSRSQDVVFAASNKPGKIDARVETTDRNPANFFTWMNNTGDEDTGRYRLGLGYRHSNLFERDHQATLTYTTSPTDHEKVDQYGGVYRWPMYRQGRMFSVFLSESEVDTGIVADFFDVAGSGSFLGMEYRQYFARVNGYAHGIDVSLTDKLFDNDIGFEDTNIGTDVRSRPLILRYTGNWVGDGTELDLYIGYHSNLGGGRKNDSESYAGSRSGANPNWSLTRFGVQYKARLQDWIVTSNLDGQMASEALIAGEQFGIGGSQSVRGFHERELTGDRGLQLRVEATSPDLTLANAQGSLFLDAGKVELNRASQSDIRRESIASIGAGMEWSWNSRLVARFDLAYVLDGTDPARSGGTRSGDERIHFSLGYRFKDR